jgi:CDP-alcohol phosphatidyltransferase
MLDPVGLARRTTSPQVRCSRADIAESRAATNELLAQLRADRWRPRAWIRFLRRAGLRSLRQARSHPRALAEASALHAALLAGCPGHRRWTITSWALTVTHLGLLGRRRTLGPANAITLLRANLPTVATPSSRWLGAVALGSDVLDGELARRGHAETLFGAHADSLADAAFWLWFTARHEPSQLLRAAALGAWAAPILAVTTTAVVRGSMIDPPRPRRLRPAAALQALLALRALRPPGQAPEGRRTP